MRLQSRVNQYPGVNAHLHSTYQAHGGWPGFHQAYIIHLQTTLQDALRPFGYLVDNTTSLQIKEGSARQYVERADLGVRDFRSPGTSYPQAVPSQRGTFPVLELSILDAAELTEEQYLRAIAVRQINPDDGRPGRVVTWIEVLSPSNKPGGPDFQNYHDKRISVIAAGIPLVELDFLHKRPPVVAGLPRYQPTGSAPRDLNAMPYYVAVTDPRPTMYEGKTVVYPFSPADPIPPVEIPLAAAESLAFDFGLPYNMAFSMDAHAYLVDYAGLPAEFDTYNERDQRYIQALMAVITAHITALDSGPFPVSLSE